MIRMVQSVTAEQAKAYFADALVKADYYTADQEMNGAVRGRLASRLGIAGPATKEVFFALCENRNPVTGEGLTARTGEHRRTGYDLNFHCPKSVSVVHALSGDSHILDAFHEAVSQTMTDIEADAKARVRKGRRDTDRQTGELVYVDFIHQTARPVDGSPPDPHLHAHCYVFNATYDSEERMYKAAELGDVKRDMPYYEALFHKRLSDKLIGLGYGIRRTAKSFEIEGVPKAAIDLFSKRTDEIGRFAKEKGITDAKALSELGARTRAAKQKGLGMEDLKISWRQQLRALDADHGSGEGGIIRGAPDRKSRFLSPERAVDHTLEHSFARASVMPYRKLMTAALRFGIGAEGLSIGAIDERLKADPRLIEVESGSQSFCTTKEVLAEEQRMVELAQAGIGVHAPLYGEAPVVKATGQQGEAIRRLLTNHDGVTIIRGAAGAGKTTLMQEAVPLIEATGKKVTLLAPSSSASRGTLRKEGFEQADTVATFLKSGQAQGAIKDGVLWVDEAGLLGTKPMLRLLEITKRQNAKLILGGDTRQHAAVDRGDALRILNTVGGIEAAEVTKIYRQKPKDYREAVDDLSKGNVKDGFEKLDRMGAIKTIDPLKPNEELVDDYIKLIREGKTGLIISPTHKQSEEVTDAIRKGLREQGIIGKKEIRAEKLTNLNLTEAQKRDWRNYQPGQIVQFSQNLKGVKRGSQWYVGVKDEQVTITDETGATIPLPGSQPDKFNVYQRSEIALSKGDRVRITNNGFDREKSRLDNGDMLDVLAVTTRGDIRLQNTVSKKEYHLGKEFGHIAHAHCITSYAAQGKTVDQVLVAQPAATFPATNAKQFYVSVSRAREKVAIYTDDKESLLKHASLLGDRQSAMELERGISTHTAHLERMREIERERAAAAVPDPSPAKHYDTDRDYDYGPGL